MRDRENVAALLERAAARIESEGAWTHVVLALRAMALHIEGGLVRWNNAPGRLQSEVVAEMRECARRVRAGEIEV